MDVIVKTSKTDYESIAFSITQDGTTSNGETSDKSVKVFGSVDDDDMVAMIVDTQTKGVSDDGDGGTKTNNYNCHNANGPSGVRYALNVCLPSRYCNLTVRAHDGDVTVEGSVKDANLHLYTRTYDCFYDMKIDHCGRGIRCL